ncbi:hypothetical protein MesoLj131a_66240 (plasmid) [Mesorhizobium sp. 131-2-1]|nr:hypothetical protein MesoLj131a_66240 [Mesorhizobium sp. 131-2-1]
MLVGNAEGAVRMATDYGGWRRDVRREVFVSYHHRGDQAYYDAFSRMFHDSLRLITDNSLERKVDSNDPGYIMRRIREHHLHGSSCTIVLCGADTWRRKFVDWEIYASLDQQMGLVGVRLPTLLLAANGGTAKPQRLQDNIDSAYAPWVQWNDIANDAGAVQRAVETALERPRSTIANTRQRMVRNL